MSKHPYLVSATIVLIFTGALSNAAPDETFPPEDKSTEEVWSETPLPAEMQISKPDPTPEKLRPAHVRYYPYQQQLTVRYGRASDFPKLRFNENVTGFQYMFPKFLSPKLEAGADLHDDGVGHVHAGWRWIYNERGYFRPSAKLSADVLIDGEEGLATFAEVSNYFVRTTGTIELVVWNPYSIRLENELYVGSKRCIYSATLGLSRGW